MADEQANQAEQLLKLVNDALQQDQSLRAEYNTGDKFRFIRDRLHILSQQITEQVTRLQLQVTAKQQILTAEETLVYVYLYNTHGLHLVSWQKMVNPSVFYEYSVNRPIYADKAGIEAWLRAKTNQNQHGYLTIAVKKKDILPISATDSFGHTLVKVKEGALHADKMQSLTTNGHEYKLTERGELVRKE